MGILTFGTKRDGSAAVPTNTSTKMRWEINMIPGIICLGTAAVPGQLATICNRRPRADWLLSHNTSVPSYTKKNEKTEETNFPDFFLFRATAVSQQFFITSAPCCDSIHIYYTAANIG